MCRYEYHQEVSITMERTLGGSTNACFTTIQSNLKSSLEQFCNARNQRCISTLISSLELAVRARQKVLINVKMIKTVAENENDLINKLMSLIEQFSNKAIEDNDIFNVGVSGEQKTRKITILT